MIQATFRIVPPPGKRDEILEVLSILKGPTEVSKGSRGSRALQDADDERVITYIELWENWEDLKAHIRSERFRRILPYIDMSVEPPQVEFSNLERVKGMEFLVSTLGSKAGAENVVTRTKKGERS